MLATIPGDPRSPDAQAALLEALDRRYAHGSGLLLPIPATCIDSGFATESVYDFVLELVAAAAKLIGCVPGAIDV